MGAIQGYKWEVSNGGKGVCRRPLPVVLSSSIGNNPCPPFEGPTALLTGMYARIILNRAETCGKWIS